MLTHKELSINSDRVYSGYVKRREIRPIGGAAGIVIDYKITQGDRFHQSQARRQEGAPQIQQVEDAYTVNNAFLNFYGLESDFLMPDCERLVIEHSQKHGVQVGRLIPAGPSG